MNAGGSVNVTFNCSTDELEMVGCTDSQACNYNPEATVSDTSCIFPEIYYDCDGNCINDSDLNGICDELDDPGIIQFYPPEGSTYNEDNTEITLPSASLGENYNEAIEIDVPEFLTIELNGEVYDLPINFVEITGVTIPNGMSYSCNVEGCYFGSNTSGDIILSGTPTQSGLNELSLTSLLSINGAPIGVPLDINLTIPYTGGNVLLDAQLQGDYSVLNDAIPTFYLNVEGGGQLGCTNPEATNYNVEATQDDSSCQSLILIFINPSNYMWWYFCRFRRFFWTVYK